LGTIDEEAHPVNKSDISMRDSIFYTAMDATPDDVREEDSSDQEISLKKLAQDPEYESSSSSSADMSR